MKKILYASSSLVLLLLCLTFAFAQRSDVEARPFKGKFLAEKIAQKLELTDEQKTRIREILQSQRERVRPLMQEKRQIHLQMKNLGKDGVFDEARVSELATRKAEIDKQLTIEFQRTKASIFAVLTSEQRAKMEQMQSEFKSRLRERLRNRFPNGFQELPKQDLRKSN
jgi:protein CpxP